MKKLTLVTLISGALSASAFAGGGMDKAKIENSFSALDNDSNGMITLVEVDQQGLQDHFAKIDSNTDYQLSKEEFNTFLTQNPKHFEEVAQTRTTEDGDEIANEYGIVNMEHGEDNQWGSNPDNPDRTPQQTYHSDDEWSSLSDDETNVAARNEFEMMDSDKDGQLSKEETTRSDVKASFEDIDENGDDLITRVEYTDYRQNKNYDYDDE